jgi:diacylglycerol kinase (ATP)
MAVVKSCPPLRDAPSMRASRSSVEKDSSTAAATVLVVAAGFALRISPSEWCAILAASGLVWLGEGLNTAIETLTDLVSPGPHPLAGRAKDIAAGAVLCAALAALAIGVVVFLPHLAELVAR